MTEDEKMKGRMVWARIGATMALMGALLCTHQAFATHGWQGAAFAAFAGLLASQAVLWTIKASVYAAALVTTEAFKIAERKGMFDR